MVVMKTPVKSPLQAQLGSPLFLVKLASDLLKVHAQFLSKVDEFIGESKNLSAERARIIELPEGKQGLRGEKGDSIVGPAGPQGVKGRDGVDGKDGHDGLDGMPADINTIAELAASLITQPKDGESPALEAVVEAVLEAIKIEDRLESFRTEMASYRNQLAGKSYGKDTWARGGGSTVSAGANITLTPLPNGTVQINASGGGSGTNVTTQYSLTAVLSGSDVTIDLTQLTHFATYAGLVQVQRNNIPQTEMINFTQTGTQVTIFNADASEIFNLVYQYT